MARAAVEEAAGSLSLFGSLRHNASMEGWDQLVQHAKDFMWKEGQKMLYNNE